MNTFEIKEEFLLNGEPFKILSGAVHYFRILPEHWYHTLYNLKALGFNTVETYIPWNIHEPKEGEFDFSGRYDIEKFVKTAEKLGLYVILRPSPYICAEWEFGGLPAWLLPYKDIRIRSSDPKFIEKVEEFYKQLFKILTPLQIDQGGSVLMMQVENEYGSYGEDKEYIKSLYDLMIDLGVTIPIFTSDGAWWATQAAGTLTEEGILTTGNFGSHSKENFAQLKSFQEYKGKNWPLMVMEFWDGWFSHWGKSIVTRDGEELAEDVKEAIELGSVNLYMFHGGTNFGFLNGCNAYEDNVDLPQITSYDYDAPLDEQGNPTPKYYALQMMMKEVFPDKEIKDPLIKNTMEIKNIELTNKVSLFSIIEDIAEKQITKYPLSMEELGQAYGYTLYRTTTQKDAERERYRVIDASDRVHFFFNEELITTQYQEEIGKDIQVTQEKEENQIDLLVENIGRVNYGHKLLANTQSKGIRTGVMSDLHFMLDWEQYSLDFSTAPEIDYEKDWKENTPSFYQYKFTVKKIEDTFLNLEHFGKGVVLVNGFNIGRFWEIGPTHSLYIPKGLLNEGENEITVFETDGKWADEINLEHKPKFIETKN